MDISSAKGHKVIQAAYCAFSDNGSVRGQELDFFELYMIYSIFIWKRLNSRSNFSVSMRVIYNTYEILICKGYHALSTYAGVFSAGVNPGWLTHRLMSHVCESGEAW